MKNNGSRLWKLSRLFNESFKTKLKCMKKAAFTFVVLCIFISSVYGQKKNQDDKWLVTAGPVIAFPMKFLHQFHSFGIGGDISAIHPITNGFSVGGRANYVYFFGKQSSNNYGTTISSHYDATHIFNLLGDVNYLFDNGLILGVDLGLGVSVTHVYADATFARIVYVAYQVNGKSPIVFGLYFDQTNFQKNIGLRVTFRI